MGNDSKKEATEADPENMVKNEGRKKNYKDLDSPLPVPIDCKTINRIDSETL